MFTDLPVWAYISIIVILTQITIASVTIFLHRTQAHRSVALHPLMSHFFRYWLWLTTGIITKEWVSVHRKHHAKVDSTEDPHSPQILGLKRVLTRGAELYRHESSKLETLEKYGHDTPDDWVERNLYTKYSYAGVWFMLIINCSLFGALGLTIWAVQMMWIPIFAAGVINGLGHWWGYRNFEPEDASTNIFPLGFFIGGEELHNNHHAFASSAKFSNKWYELDLGWCCIRALQFAGFARVKKLAPSPVLDYQKNSIDAETIKAIISNRFYVMSHYASSVIKQVYREEKIKLKSTHLKITRSHKKLLIRQGSLLDDAAKARLNKLLSENEQLKTVYDFGLKLQSIWQNKHASQESLMDSLREWCNNAEKTGIKALEEFSQTVRAYRMQEVY